MCIRDSGDGSSTFTLPDYRGRFLRGFNNTAGTDPDASSRTNRGDGTTGDAVGTKQADEFETHNHNMQYYRNGSNAVSGSAYMMIGGYQGSLTASTNNYPLPEKGGSTETRPTNINVMYCIKL